MRRETNVNPGMVESLIFSLSSANGNRPVKYILIAAAKTEGEEMLDQPIITSNFDMEDMLGYLKGLLETVEREGKPREVDRGTLHG